MTKVTRESLMSLETYAKARPEFRARVIAHRRTRSVHLGDRVTLQFEDELTIRYRIQEMLRVERIFEEDGIAHELDSHNPLIPDGRNLKATLLIDHPDPEQRRLALAQLRGIEQRVWIQVEGSPRLWAMADDDPEHDDTPANSALHYVRFDLTEDMVAALKYGVTLAIGIEHGAYRASVAPLPAETRAALVADLA